MTKPGKRGWSLIVVKEYWWAGREKDAMRMPHWAKLNSGQRSDVLEWFHFQERALEVKLSSHTTPGLER